MLPVLLVVSFAAYARVLDLSFFSDDFSVLYRLVGTAADRPGSFFRPLSEWSLIANHRLTGPSPLGFRVVNVALLGLNAWLIHLLVLRLLAQHPVRHAAGTIAALLFVLYPFHIEPQLWIIARGASLATLFILLALVVATGPGRPWTIAMGTFTLASLGMLCYETALLLPLLLLPLLLVVNERGLRAAVVAAVAALLVNLLLRLVLTGTLANTYGTDMLGHGLPSLSANVPKVLGRLVLPPSDKPGLLLGLFAVVIATLIALGLLLRKRIREELRTKTVVRSLLLLLFIACTVGFVGGVSTRTSESDRFLYLPSAFLCMLVGIITATLLAPRWRIVTTAVLAMLSSAALRIGQGPWHEASRTIDRIVHATPEAPPNGRLLVWNLPGEHHGAFIFRHGYREALAFAGKEPSRVRISPEGPNAIWEFLRTETGDTLHRNDNDRWFDAGSANTTPAAQP